MNALKGMSRESSYRTLCFGPCRLFFGRGVCTRPDSLDRAYSRRKRDTDREAQRVACGDHEPDHRTDPVAYPLA